MATENQLTNHISAVRQLLTNVREFEEQYPDRKSFHTNVASAVLTDDDFIGQNTGITDAEYDAAILAADAFLAAISGVNNAFKINADKLRYT